MARPTRLWFIRHGEVEAPYVGTFLGVTDVGLSELGRHQAQAVGAFLADAPVDVVLSSPLRRARDTAAPLAAAHGIEVVARDGFREMDFGAWETLSWPQIEARDPDYAPHWQEDPATRPCPDGEAAQPFADRVNDTLDAVLEEFTGHSIALFAHAGVNRAILSRLTGRPYMESFVYAQDYGCVNAAAWDIGSGMGQIALVNAVPGPRSVDNGDGGRRVEETK